jgi:hypothetical protein
MSLKLAIAVGPGQRLHPSTLISRLALIWRERGHNIEVTSGRKLAGDIGFLHIDTTRIKVGLLPSYPANMPVVNGRAIDISKRKVSHNLVTSSDAYAGPVIVKTNDNYYGLRHVPKWPQQALIDALRKVVSRRSWRFLRTLPRTHYPVLSSKTEIPSWVWQRDDLVVERFLPEIDQGLFVLRCWVFLGQRDYGVKLYGREPIVKADSVVRYEYLKGVPDTLRAERERLGFDFGKFDYVHHNGTAVLLDANNTPATTGRREVTPNLLNLAEGLTDFCSMR